ncbi:polynucleotide 3'-phosphatase [Phytophthora pseudosyringae]|uniref:Polynucleotide 3'-phosphatase n=1 Tax=Phytophthora pseudosyringae TaxID=221518 RepID=A0A8T1VA81_9STRA|nr:polynucleotide 3'-phosphatase [Phytophthora pseudosyringae]
MKARIVLRLSALLLLLSAAFHLSAIVSAAGVENARKVGNAHPTHWERGPRAAPELVLALRVALNPRKSDGQLGELVAAVTDPASPLYGQHLTTPAQLQKHFKPPASSLRSFLRVVQDAQVLQLEPVDAVQDFWHVKLSAATAERLFSTKMFHYAHRQRAGLSVVRPEQSYSIPQELDRVVAYVDGLESFPTEMQARFMQGGVTDDKDPLAVKQQVSGDFRVSSKGATPAVIREQYDIPEKIPVNYSRGLPDESAPTDQVDRNKLVVGTFLHEFYNEQDLYQFLHTIDGQHQTIKLPKTTGQCTSTYGPTGEASLDVQVTASLTGHGTGDASGIEMLCYTQLRDPTRDYAADNQEPFLTFLQDVNAMQPPPAVVSISYTDDECSVPISYAEAVNRELMKAALRGISILVSAGDAGVRGSHLAEAFCRVPACSKFMSMFPASSPYVTAVGATTIATGSARDGSGKWKEAVTSTSEARALITSGGGFSDLYDMPEYQRKAVSPYLDFASSSGLSPFFRSTGRAMPDVAAVGHAFPVVVNGEVGATDGTSVSAPVLASMITLLNRALPDLPPLGFLNPLLYRLYDVCPQVFADITQGNISCGSKGMKCCKKGHVATTGWDAASGLGTLRFSTLLSDLPHCLARMKASNDFAAVEQLSTILLDEEESDEDATIQVKSWTSVEQRAAQVLGVVGLIGAMGLVAVLVALRERLFLDSGDSQRAGSRRYGSCAAHDSAREYLLSR